MSYNGPNLSWLWQVGTVNSSAKTKKFLFCETPNQNFCWAMHRFVGNSKKYCRKKFQTTGTRCVARDVIFFTNSKVVLVPYLHSNELKIVGLLSYELKKLNCYLVLCPIFSLLFIIITIPLLKGCLNMMVLLKFPHRVHYCVILS